MKSCPQVKVVITSNDLSPATRMYMWSIFKRHYAENLETFQTYLANMNYLALYLAEGYVIGFSGVRVAQEKKKQLNLYIGQAIIEPCFHHKPLFDKTQLKLLKRHLRVFFTHHIYVGKEPLPFSPKTSSTISHSKISVFSTWKSGIKPILFPKRAAQTQELKALTFFSLFPLCARWMFEALDFRLNVLRTQTASPILSHLLKIKRHANL